MLAGKVMAGNMMEERHAEGIDAFIAKRKPVWTGAERRAPILHGLARPSRSRNFCTLPVDVWESRRTGWCAGI